MQDKKQWTWKTCAIVLLIVCILETALIVYTIVSAVSDNYKLNECYFNFCSGYPDAWYQDDVCTCYEYNYSQDELVVAKERFMG